MKRSYISWQYHRVFIVCFVIACILVSLGLAFKDIIFNIFGIYAFCLCLAISSVLIFAYNKVEIENDKIELTNCLTKKNVSFQITDMKQISFQGRRENFRLNNGINYWTIIKVDDFKTLIEQLG